MEISPEEAQKSLDEINSVIAQTRKAIAHSCSSEILMVWGIAWVLGYLGNQFFPEKAGAIWLPLIVLGVACSIYFPRKKKAVRGRFDARIGLFWLVLYFYVMVWTLLLYPFNFRHMPAFGATVPMFAYVVGGLWLGRFFVWLGLSVTALAVLGVFLAGPYLNLWMAAAGGGSLIWSAIYIRKYWR